jgi:hypothetical protein
LLLGPGIGDFGGGFQPCLARHANVQEQQIGQPLQRLLHGADAVGHPGFDLQLGPELAQQLLQGQGQQRFVFGNQGARWAGVHGWGFRGNTMQAWLRLRCRLSTRLAALP